MSSPWRARLRRLPAVRSMAVAARFGDLRRTAPLTSWGSRRGLPVDRWYVEAFLTEHAALVHGRVLEVKSDQYGSRFGASEVEVVDIDPTNPDATVVGDLCSPGTLAPARYDAALITQTLHLVDDPGSALRHLVGALRPGAPALVTVPSASRICGPGDKWRWTPEGFEHLLRSAVPECDVVVRGYGNSLTGRAFLFGLAADDLPAAALLADDVNYPLVVGAVVTAPSRP